MEMRGEKHGYQLSCKHYLGKGNSHPLCRPPKSNVFEFSDPFGKSILKSLRCNITWLGIEIFFKYLFLLCACILKIKDMLLLKYYCLVI